MKRGVPDIARVMKVVDHPMRRRIIELIGSRGALSWKEISSEIGVGTGSLYYHIDTLEGLVSRDSSKKYVLTEYGKDVYLYLSENPLVQRAGAADMKLPFSKGPLTIVQGAIAPRSLINRMTSTRFRSTSSLFVISLIVVLVLVYSNEVILLFSFTPSTNIALLIGSYVLSLFSAAAIAYFGAFSVFKERLDLSILLSSVALSFLPVAAFAGFLHALSVFGGLGALSERAAVTVVLVAFQAWGIGILGAGMSVGSGLRIEKALLIGLLLLYASMVILFVQGRLL